VIFAVKFSVRSCEKRCLLYTVLALVMKEKELITIYTVTVYNDNNC